MKRLRKNVLFGHRALSGFSLIEMMVAVSIFAIVMMIAVGALFSLIETNRRAQAINAVMSNLNASLEVMSRSIRVGTTYHCRTSIAVPIPGELSSPRDCATGRGQMIAFEGPSGNPSDQGDQVVYRVRDGRIERSSNAGQSWIALTAPEVQIESFEIFLIGSSPRSSGDTTQPRVIVYLSGFAEVPRGRTEFSIQSGITQRILDL